MRMFYKKKQAIVFEIEKWLPGLVDKRIKVGNRGVIIGLRIRNQKHSVNRALITFFNHCRL